jgi:hypothetical protein
MVKLTNLDLIKVIKSNNNKNYILKCLNYIKSKLKVTFKAAEKSFITSKLQNLKSQFYSNFRKTKYSGRFDLFIKSEKWIHKGFGLHQNPGKYLVIFSFTFYVSYAYPMYLSVVRFGNPDRGQAGEIGYKTNI